MSNSDTDPSAAESTWVAADNPGAVGFSVAGVPDGWGQAGHVRIDGLPAMAWFAPTPRATGFAANAFLAVWTAHVAPGRLDDLLSALSVPDSADGLILMDRPVVLADTADVFTQRADAVIQSPFGPLSSRVWHSIRRERDGDRVSMGRLTVTVARTDTHLLEGFDLRQ